MQRISLKKFKFQRFLDALVFIFQLFFGAEPETEIKSPVFPMPVNPRRALVEKAVAAFELKKSGGAR